jgi:hypothetical protein
MTRTTADREEIVDQYVACWAPQRPTMWGLWEDNIFGCEHLQVFYDQPAEIEVLDYLELADLGWLLTRSLRGQINRDHQIFWSWCGNLALATDFGDPTWRNAYQYLLHLLLVRRRHRVAGPAHLAATEALLQQVNRHWLFTGRADGSWRAH